MYKLFACVNTSGTISLLDLGKANFFEGLKVPLYLTPPM